MATAVARAALRNPPSGGRRFALVGGVAAAAFTAHVAATLAGVRESVLGGSFAAVVAMVPILAWWAYARITPALRRLCGLLALAGTLWLVGTLLWLGLYFAGGQSLPPPLGVWDGVFFVAYAIGIVAVVGELRNTISLRGAALDASVIVAAGLAVGGLVVGRELERGLSHESIGTLARPILAIVLVTLIVSSALGDWDGVPISLALVGAAQPVLALGGLVYSYEIVSGSYSSMRWAGLALAAGAALSMAAASVIILGLDRPLRFRNVRRIPKHALGSKAVLYLALGALTVSVAVAFYGHHAGNSATLAVGLVTTVWIGTAMAVRARNSIGEVERAYADLDRAHVELERANDRLADTNEELALANVQLRAAQAAFDGLLAVEGERTGGAMRDAIEDAGDDIAALLLRRRDEDA
jgi:hypothetical protein